MEEIRRGGGTLRHVTSSERGGGRRPPLDTRDELLDQIRTGVVLKKVEPHEEAASAAATAATEASGIAGMLQKALAERSGALRFSSSENEDGDDEDDDEWDD